MLLKKNNNKACGHGQFPANGYLSHESGYHIPHSHIHTHTPLQQPCPLVELMYMYMSNWVCFLLKYAFRAPCAFISSRIWKLCMLQLGCSLISYLQTKCSLKNNLYPIYCKWYIFIYRNNPNCLDRQAWANSVNPDQMPHAAYDLGLPCLVRPVCPNIYGY